MEITTSQIIGKLKLKANPEGGFYTETFRDTSVFLTKSQLPDHCILLSHFIFSSLYK